MNYIYHRKEMSFVFDLSLIRLPLMNKQSEKTPLLGSTVSRGILERMTGKERFRLPCPAAHSRSSSLLMTHFQIAS